jgi:hypothetical protein
MRALWDGSQVMEGTLVELERVEGLLCEAGAAVTKARVS